MTQCLEFLNFCRLTLTFNIRRDSKEKIVEQVLQTVFQTMVDLVARRDF